MSLCRRFPRRARTSLSYRRPPPAAAIHDGNKRAGGQGPGSVQETDTRARSGSGGYPAWGSSAILYYGLERSKQLRRRPPARHRNCAPPAPPASTRSRQRPRPPTAGNTPAAHGDPVFVPPRESRGAAHVFLYKVSEAAEILSYSRTVIFELMRARRLRSVGNGKPAAFQPPRSRNTSRRLKRRRRDDQTAKPGRWRPALGQ